MTEPSGAAATSDPLAPLVLDRDAARADVGGPPESPLRIFWTHLKKSPLAIAGGAVLALFYALALVAPFVAPYSEEEMDRRSYFHPPQSLHWIDNTGSFHIRPFVRITPANELVSTSSPPVTGST